MLCPHCGTANINDNVFCTGCGSSISGRQPVGETTWNFGPGRWAQSLLGRTLEQRYQLAAIIGAGGMGTIFRATRLNIGDQVAVKVLHPLLLQDTEAAARFHREAQAAARLKHPNAIAIHDFAVTEGLYFLVMELFEGRSLRQYMKERPGPLPLPLVEAVITQVAAALDEAHRQGIIHRDIKADNLLLREVGGEVQVKVLDFGIAKLRDQASHLTRTGDIMGTPQYMSPEQCLGEEVDRPSDIYSLGIVLYEMLTGRVPFDAPSLAVVVGQHVHAAPPPPRQLNPALSPLLEAVVLRALAKNPAQRQATAGQLAQELRDALSGHAATTGTSAPPMSATVILKNPPPARQRPPDGAATSIMRKGLAIAVGLLLVLAGAFAGWRAWSSGSAKESGKNGTTPPPGMVYVPGGEFKMGSERPDDFAAPIHTVEVKPFFIDIYEVTCEEYKKFLDATGQNAPPAWQGKNYPSGKQKFPVTGVTWDEAKAYAQWAGKRLPTEEEWEFAARGTDGRRYPWGDYWQSGKANLDEANKGLVAVGSYPQGASPFGVQDLLGNAWEWTDSDLKAYPGGFYPPGIQQKDPKIIRGGNWQSTRDSISATFRSWWGAREQKSYDNTSFRCVKDAAPGNP